MSEKLTQQELEQMMDRMFSINSKNAPFFKKQFSELIKTDKGSDLLRSLNANFGGKKMKLVTHAKLGGLGYCFDDESEIGISVSGLLDYYIPPKVFFTANREVTHGYPKLLFHELTHWEQYQNQGAAENAATDEDRYFTVIMGEADAQVSGDLFKMEYQNPIHLDKGLFNPVWQMLKLATKAIADKELNSQKRDIIKKQDDLRESHPEWSEDRIEKESIKIFFKKSLLDKTSYWRRFYDNPENRKNLGILDDDPQFAKQEFPALMKYYMEKYGLTLDECLDLKKEILTQSNHAFDKEKMHKSDETTTSLVAEPHLTNAEMLSHATHSIKKAEDKIKTTPKTPKLDSAVLSHFGKGGQGK